MRLHLYSSGIGDKRSVRFFEKRTLQLHKNWIAVSRWIAQETQRHYDVTPVQCRVIYNPVVCDGNTNTVSPELPDRYVLFAGTVGDRKGAYVLAEAAKTFLPEHQDLHLVYIGGIAVEDGRSADETIRLIMGNRLSRRVHFKGLVDHGTVLACMKTAALVAFPSKLESFGLVPVEAMLCGAPVVYSKLHAGPEIVDDGITGLLADPNDPVDVAEKVNKILNDPKLSVGLARNAKIAAEDRFSLEKCIDDTLVFYSALLTEHASGYTRWKQQPKQTSKPAL